MNDLVEVIDGVARTSSRIVAEMFEKRHDHVLRAIDGLIVDCPELVASFTVNMDDAAGRATRQVRFFEMDRKGFTMLAMGFTGPAAVQWKSKFYDAFEAMEEALAHGMAPGGGVLGTADAIDRMKVALSVAREARNMFGRQAGMRVWLKLGLPDPRTMPRVKQETKYWEVIDYQPTAQLNYEPPASVVTWAARLKEDKGGTVKVSLLHADYLTYCKEHELKPVNGPIFGRALGAIGYHKRHSDGSWIDGFKLAA